MNFRLLLNTVVHLRFTQIAYQIKNRISKEKYKLYKAPEVQYNYQTSWCDKWHSCHSSHMAFLNIEDEFSNWNQIEHGMLWAYNLNYMDWLCQDDLSFDEGAIWIDRYCTALQRGEIRIGLDPYPIALRAINWVKFICKHKSFVDEGRLQIWNDALYSQIRLLERKLEFHLLGNHLLEDAFSLYISSCYFDDKQIKEKSYKLLLGQLTEQILDDGAHYELSPMYHCILLDRLLDCINFGGTLELKHFAKKMVGHLKSICFCDGSIPLFNDAANGIAPSVQQLIDYAHRLDVDSDAIELKDCGYRHYQAGNIECIADLGTIAATYQPGHTHADVTTYELYVDKKPFVIDTGISTYNKTQRRQYERSSVAHNVVTVNKQNSSEVWGGFRVGKRASSVINGDTVTVTTCYNAFLKRRFDKTANSIVITDICEGTGVSHIHLHPSVQVLAGSNDKVETNRGVITIRGAESVSVIDCEVSSEYNKLQPSKCVEIAFNGEMKYEIK